MHREHREDAVVGHQPPSWMPLLDGIDWHRISDLLRLSERELQVVKHILEGKTMVRIAEEMDLAVGTVKTYGGRVRTKLGVSDQRELMLTVLDLALRPPALEAT